jgi:glucosamine-6-phosphate deaminase
MILSTSASDSSSLVRILSLSSGVDLGADRTHALDGQALDPDDECRRYEDDLARAGGLDLALLGLGVNGHVGFNEPGESLVARTHHARLLESTRDDNAALFGGDVARVPAHALTMGMGTLLGARQLLLVATGERKADAVRAMLRGPLTTQVPASLLQLHQRAEAYLDRAAASRL